MASLVSDLEPFIISNVHRVHYVKHLCDYLKDSG